jgi:hypothetical protein
VNHSELIIPVHVCSSPMKQVQKERRTTDMLLL